MEESKLKVSVRSDGHPSLGLQDLYKAACNGNYDAEPESNGSYQLMTIKPTSYLPQDCFIESGQVSSNGIYDTADTVLDLDRGVPVEIIKKEAISYPGDPELLQRFLIENSLIKQEPSSSYITIVDMDQQVKLESNLNVDECDFNSSDSFASTESIIPKNIKCPKCSKKFMFKADLLRHDNYKHKKKFLACSFCHKEFSCKAKLSFHERSQACPAAICHLCNKSFQKPVLLTKHINITHKTSVLHKCPKCEKTFPVSENLKAHVTKCHPEVRAFYPCDVCHKYFLLKRSLRVHLRKHYIRLNCHLCNEIFFDNSELNEHMKTHIEIMPNVPLIVIDEDGKKFKCELCPKSYVNRHNYEHHLLKHSTPKVCKLCNEEFENDTELQTHIRQHTFECSICSRKFSSKTTMNRHIKRKHNNNLVEQEACTQTEEEIFQLQNVNIVVDPASGGTESFLLATPINGLGSLPSLPFYISQPMNSPYTTSPQES